MLPGSAPRNPAPSATPAPARCHAPTTGLLPSADADSALAPRYSNPPRPLADLRFPSPPTEGRHTFIDCHHAVRERLTPRFGSTVLATPAEPTGPLLSCTSRLCWSSAEDVGPPPSPPPPRHGSRCDARPMPTNPVLASAVRTEPSRPVVRARIGAVSSSGHDTWPCTTGHFR